MNLILFSHYLFPEDTWTFYIGFKSPIYCSYLIVLPKNPSSFSIISLLNSDSSDSSHRLSQMVCTMLMLRKTQGQNPQWDSFCGIVFAFCESHSAHSDCFCNTQICLGLHGAYFYLILFISPYSCAGFSTWLCTHSVVHRESVMWKSAGRLHFFHTPLWKNGELRKQNSYWGEKEMYSYCKWTILDTQFSLSLSLFLTHTVVDSRLIGTEETHSHSHSASTARA